MTHAGMTIVDAHLDLAYNACRGRDVLLPAAQQAPDEDIPTVGLPDLRDGGVGLVCATVFCEPALDGKPGYRTAEEAHRQAWQQVRWYQEQQAARRMRFVTRPADLPHPDDTRRAGDAQAAILLLEGADALRSPEDVRPWFEAGLRIVGLAWKRTRLAGGTGAPGPLTDEGLRLVRELDAFGLVHDTSHLAEESFWQLLDVSSGPVIASHSNCRRIVPTDRQLSDDMIRAVAARGGVIGINFFDKFLLPPGEYGTRRATLVDVTRHVQHVCDLVGNTTCVGIGTDMDGGLGREQIPEEIATSADLPRVAEVLSGAGFGDADVGRIMGANWLHFFNRALPRGAAGR
jgi:membrane dipeptidase